MNIVVTLVRIFRTKIICNLIPLRLTMPTRKCDTDYTRVVNGSFTK